jgi:hypothetical protein
MRPSHGIPFMPKTSESDPRLKLSTVMDSDYWSTGAAQSIPVRAMVAGLFSRFSVLRCPAHMQILRWADSPCKESYHVSKYTYIVAEKSVNLKHPLVLMGVFRFKPASQFVRRTASQLCELCTEHGGSQLETKTNKQTNSVALVRRRTIPTERPPLLGEVSANFCG